MQEIVSEKNDQDLRQIAWEAFEDGIKGNKEVKHVAKEMVENAIEDNKNKITEMNEQKKKLIVYGLDELVLARKESLSEAETVDINEITKLCHIKVQ